MFPTTHAPAQIPTAGKGTRPHPPQRGKTAVTLRHFDTLLPKSVQASHGIYSMLLTYLQLRRDENRQTRAYSVTVHSVHLYRIIHVGIKSPSEQQQ